MSTVVRVIAALLLCLALPRPSDAAAILRVCADPDNLPFSSSEGADRGLYVELAELVAARMGAHAEYFWWRSYFGKRTVRNTLLSDQCDAYFGLPYDKQFMSQSVTLTRPFLSMGYALIAPRPFAPASLDDLKGKKVAVQFGSFPQILLSSREGQEVATFRLAEEALEALTRREVQAAFVWGPTAGYYNKTRLGGQYEIVSVSGPGLAWQASVGVRKGKDDLRLAIERELALLEPEIARLAEKYGFPSGRTISAESATRGGARPAVVAVAEDMPSGRYLFNQHCAHCHAPNALSPEPSRDLRRLKTRYGERMIEITYKTVVEGRPTKGMPTWGGTLSLRAIQEIVAFLESVQH